MRKRIAIILLASLCVFVITACGKMQKDEKKEQELRDVQAKESIQIDTERYQAYIKVLSEIVERRQWPDGSSIPEVSWSDSFGSNQFAICDSDKDGNEELFVKINDVAVAEMQTRVFGYDRDLKQVVEEGIWSSGRDVSDSSHEENYIPYEDLLIDNIDLIRHYVETEGAVRGINLLPEKVISEYDVTGDGEKDSISIRCVEENKDFPGYGIRWSISINDQIVHEIKDEWGVKPEIRLYSVSEKRNYFSIGQYRINNGDIADFALYQAEEEQLKKVCNFYSDFLDSAHVFHYGGKLQIMTKDELILLCSNQFNATAHMSWKMEFDYKDNKWILCGTEHQIVYETDLDAEKDGMTANQDFVVYKTIACSEEAFIVQKGEVVTIDKLSIKDGRICFRVTNSQGKEGWLPDSQEQSCMINGEWLEGYFEEAMFAG